MTAEPLPFGQHMAIQFHGNMGFAEFTSWSDFYAQVENLDLQIVELGDFPLMAFNGDFEEFPFFVRTRPELTRAEQVLLSQLAVGISQREDMQEILTVPVIETTEKKRLLIDVSIPKVGDDIDLERTMRTIRKMIVRRIGQGEA